MFTDGQGRRLYDAHDAPRPDPDTPAPVRLLAPFDNLLLSHADRTRVLSDEDRKVVFMQNGIVRSTILVGGYVRGLWDIKRGGRRSRSPVPRTVQKGRCRAHRRGAAPAALRRARAQRHDITLAPTG